MYFNQKNLKQWILYNSYISSDSVDQKMFLLRKSPRDDYSSYWRAGATISGI